ncbi:MAG: transcriptional repressor [Bacteroidales bacterium]|jgi:Fur family peroxide stress response transcriptional regulator|nr:transcriptional repressor [Bacteroidales bacterium]
MANKEVIRILMENDLRVTPQRTAVLEVIMTLEFHPTVDDVIDYIRLNLPNVPYGTVYKILDTFAKKGIIHKIKTSDDAIRYDAVKEKHHHLYCEDSEKIEDYFDDDLDKLLENYFRKKKIPNFTIKEYKVQIMGEFTRDGKETK